MKKIVSGIMLMFFLLNVLLIALNTPRAVGVSSTKPRVFRLLAIEQMFDSYSIKSAQYLIKALLKYPNWNNSTDDYVSYIHLISMYNYSEVDDEVKPFWVGKLGSVDLRNEIISFLGNVSAGEIVIFYYCGHSTLRTHPPPPRSVFLGLTTDTLRGWLNSTISKAYLTLILDTCYSGFWTGFSPKSTVLAACGQWQEAWGTDCGFFTQSLITGFSMANDSNSDGWLSYEEVFPYAKNSTETIVTWAKQNPESYYSFAEGDVPLIQRDAAMPFPVWDVAITSMCPITWEVEPDLPVIVNVTVENQGEKLANVDVTLYDNSSFLLTQQVTVFPGQLVNATFTWISINFYGTCVLRSNVSLCPGEEDIDDNFCEVSLIVKFREDVNIDGAVDIEDIFLAALALGATPDQPRWNPYADMDRNNVIEITDLNLIAENFGKIYE
jgi:hypothetical protein